MAKYMISTRDNPYDPYENFDAWFMFDIDKGYNSCGLLARVAHTSDALSEEENDLIVEKAIDEIIKYDFQNIYTKIKVS